MSTPHCRRKHKHKPKPRPVMLSVKELADFINKYEILDGENFYDKAASFGWKVHYPKC